LARLEASELALTEFTLYSLGVILTRLKRQDLLLDFVADTVEDSKVGHIRLEPADIKRIVAVCQQYGLDFDDAYQYVAAEKYGLTLVSFDKDFDRTSRGRKTPADIQSA